MNIRDIIVFQTVAKTRNVTEAAKLLYLSPQGVSKIIKNTESEFGCQLFDRSSAGFIPTRSGKCFLEYLDKISLQINNLKKDLDRIKQDETYSVDLISAYGIIRLLTPDCLVRFKEIYRQIEFAYREYPDMNVERYFKNGEGNIAFVVGEKSEYEDIYDVDEIASFPIKLLVNKNNPLSLKRSVTIDDLRNQSLYIESNAFKIYHIIVNKCHEAGFEPNIVFQTCGFSLCKKMVADNKGITVMVDFIFDDMGEANQTMIPFSDGDYRWTACMLTRKSQADTPAISMFKQHVLEWKELLKTGIISR